MDNLILDIVGERGVYNIIMDYTKQLENMELYSRVMGELKFKISHEIEFESPGYTIAKRTRLDDYGRILTKSTYYSLRFIRVSNSEAPFIMRSFQTYYSPTVPTVYTKAFSIYELYNKVTVHKSSIL